MPQSKMSYGSASVLSENMTALKKKQKKINKSSVFRHNFFSSLFYRTEKYKVNGPESESFHRRTYELPIQSLQHVSKQNIGFTNQILCKREKDYIQLFVPVSLSIKIKNIQQIALGELLAKLGCVLIVFIYVQGLPQEIIEHLSANVMVQINRGDSFLLRETVESGKITLKKSKKFLVFTIRDSFPVQIVDDVFLSPFEILNLVFSVTINSTKVKIDKKPEEIKIQQLINSAKSSSQSNKTEYNISFNSMRHPLQVPITYATDCRLGVYDLAQQLLEIYSTNKATYQEAIYSFEDFITSVEENKSNKVKNIRKNSRSQKQLSKLEPIPQERQQKKKHTSQKIKTKTQYNFFPPQARQDEPLELVLENKKEKKEKKVKYFQYTHFIIPLYKMPGNSFSTIFIPMFMLSLLSIFIFLQETDSFTEQLGSIATFVLGFIALIPSIKDQLPPSQKITISQIIIYVESVNCMLSLPDKYWARGKKSNIWKDKLFLISMAIHLICFMVVIVLLLLHYLVWQKRYNLNQQPGMSSPKDHFKAWNNPYCDQQFLKFNQIAKQQKKYEKMIVPWPIDNLQKIIKEQTKQEK